MQDSAASARFSFRASFADSFRQMRRLLFAPFDAGLWFRLGFCVWLAGLGFRGLGFQFPWRGQSQRPSCPDPNWQAVVEFFKQNWPLAAGIGAALAAIILIFWVVILWLNSRALFMTLDSLATGQARIGQSWRYFRKQGQEVFWFRLALAAGYLMATLCLAVLCAAAFLPYFEGFNKTLGGGQIAALAVCVVGFIAVGLAYKLMDLVVCDLVGPLLYRFDVAFGYAWRWGWRIIGQHIGVFVKYLFCLLLLHFLLFLMMMAAMIGACVCFCCISWVFLVPIVGGYLLNVFLLPLSVWRRYFALSFLASFGDSYNLLMPVAPPSASAPAAVVPPEATDPAI